MRFGVLGVLVARDAFRGDLAPRSPMARSLLAALLLEPNRVLPLDRLEDLLWAGNPPVRARASLHNHLMRLRRSLGDSTRVRSEAGGLVLTAAPDEVDHTLLARHLEAARTARLRADWEQVGRETDAALSLWHGAPLAEFPTLAHAAAAQVAEWQEARLQAVELRGEASLRQGRLAELLPELRRLTEEFPLRESFHAQLVRALHRTGGRAEALEAYHRLRRTLVHDMGVEPGPVVRAAYQAALEDEPVRVPGPDRGGRARRGTRVADVAPRAEEVAAPTALPRQAAAFTGRDREIDRLLDAVPYASADDPGAVQVLTVDGMPGVGKTALAVHVAHRLKSAFPDGQIFLTLHAHTSGAAPVAPVEALTSLLLAVGELPERVPTDQAALASLWRSRLAGRRFLVVLDDALNSEQVEPLLPGTPGSLVLVTSRQRLEALVDATPLTLGLLTPEASVTLLVAKAARVDITADDPAVPALGSLCGHLPLALQLVSARLRHRLAWGPADVVAELRAAHGGLDALSSENTSVEAAFALSYRDLSPRSRRLFQRIGLLPGDSVDVHAAAAAEDVPLGTARALLDDLESRHLLEERVRGRYRMHDLVRAYARERAAEDTGDSAGAAVERVLDYYLSAAVEADRHLARHAAAPGAGLPAHGTAVLPVLRAAEDARAWMQAEQENLVAAVRHAARHGFTAHAHRLPAAMAEFLRTTGHWSEALRLHGTALAAALTRSDLGGQAQARLDTAMINCLRGDYEQAEAGFRTALELVRELRDRQGEGIALHGLGRVQRLTGRFGDAMRSERGALACFVDTGDARGQVAARIDIGHLHQSTGDYWEAAQYLERALEPYGEREDERSRANTLTMLADVLTSLGRYEESIARHREALVLYVRLANPLGEANARVDLGDVLRLTGAYDEAAESIEEALRLFREIGSRLGEAQSLTYLARVDLRRGRPEAAESGLCEALAFCEELGSLFGRAYATMHLAEARSSLGAHTDAVALARAGIELCRQTRDRGGRARALVILGDLRLAEGAWSKALECHEEALALADAIRAPYEEARACEGAGRALGELGRSEEGRAFLRRALAVDERLGAPDAARVRGLLRGAQAL
ncbi:AfsR/SARP family transcriptional regulator [Streptomyces flavochromogenes]|uniref:AfsR/SARP family transcriptional regulator n=1 Tax=Streptomyces flavochromogenes TaxID=68199 RepID=UPI00131E840C|nr:tetratricopeptide repeat protein [Streptomyces flavochromogenes]